MEIESYIKKLLLTKEYLPIDELMSIAMTHTYNAYYRTKQPIGKYGDFITAPEISQMFGEMIAVYCVHTWQQLGCPTKINIIELGPGKGTLLSDILRATKHIKHFHQAINLILVEINQKLISIQHNALSKFGIHIKWVKSIESIDNSDAAIILANEFFDALPIKQYTKLHTNQLCNLFESCSLPSTDKCELRWYENVVRIDKNNNLYFDKILVKNSTILQELQLHNNSRCGAVVEVSYPQRNNIATISGILKQNNGVCLIVDYGYYIHPDCRSYNQYSSTLQGVKNHQYNTVLSSLGIADISAHVDFRVLKEVALKSGMTVLGPVSQSVLLRELGIDLRLKMLKQKNQGNYKIARDLDQQYYRLTSHEEMGTLFKAMSIVADSSIIPLGFQI